MMKPGQAQAPATRRPRYLVPVGLAAMLTVCAAFGSAPANAQNRIPDASNSSIEPRQRVSLDSAWRFHSGDPEGDSTHLLYDVRPQVLTISADRTSLHADGQDLSFVTVKITDAKGGTAPRADAPIQFTIAGPGEIVATDNGDPTSLESFQSPRRRAFNGLCLAVVRTTTGRRGTIVVRAESPGLEGASVPLKSN
jgi:hypothetical protein